MSRVYLNLPDGIDPIGDYIASLARTAAGDPTDHELAQIEGMVARGWKNRSRKRQARRNPSRRNPYTGGPRRKQVESAARFPHISATHTEPGQYTVPPREAPLHSRYPLRLTAPTDRE